MQCGNKIIQLCVFLFVLFLTAYHLAESAKQTMQMVGVRRRLVLFIVQTDYTFCQFLFANVVVYLLTCWNITKKSAMQFCKDGDRCFTLKNCDENFYKLPKD